MLKSNGRVFMLVLFVLCFGLFHSVLAAVFPRVDADLKIYDDTIAAKKAEFSGIPTDPSDTGWVKRKISHMVDIDQYMRKYSEIPFAHGYSKLEKLYFQEQFGPRWHAVDESNTRDLKELLRVYGWFSVSQFGAKADREAWLLVQHADEDPAFQSEVLNVLDELWTRNETSRANYAYLFDRVAASWHDVSKRKLQRYGTQGACTGPARWEMIPVEEPAALDQRRLEMGLSTEAAYLKIVSQLCH